jgi:hypothetical protein
MSTSPFPAAPVCAGAAAFALSVLPPANAREAQAVTKTAVKRNFLIKNSLQSCLRLRVAYRKNQKMASRREKTTESAETGTSPDYGKKKD